MGENHRGKVITINQLSYLFDNDIIQRPSLNLAFFSSLNIYSIKITDQY